MAVVPHPHQWRGSGEPWPGSPRGPGNASRLPDPTPQLLLAAASAPSSGQRQNPAGHPGTVAGWGLWLKALAFPLPPSVFKPLSFEMTKQEGADLPGAPIALGCPMPGVPSMPGRALRTSASPQTGEGRTGWEVAGAAPASRRHLLLILKILGKWWSCPGLGRLRGVEQQELRPWMLQDHPGSTFWVP